MQHESSIVEFTSISSEEIRRSAPPEDDGGFLSTSFDWIYWNILVDAVSEAIFFDSAGQEDSDCLGNSVSMNLPVKPIDSWSRGICDCLGNSVSMNLPVKPIDSWSRGIHRCLGNSVSMNLP
ncbi:unnamed protein product, partial [Protopolystoma xenopodis]